jgi:hypothetical protein
MKVVGLQLVPEGWINRDQSIDKEVFVAIRA